VGPIPGIVRRSAEAGRRSAAGAGGLPRLQPGGQLDAEPIRERFPHRGQGRAEAGPPARFAARQFHPGPAEHLHQPAEIRQRARGLTVEEDLPLL